MPRLLHRFTTFLLFIGFSAGVYALPEPLIEEYLNDAQIHDVSKDNRYVLFNSRDTEIPGLAPELQSGYRQVYMLDTANSTIKLISKSYSGTPSNGNSFSPFFINNSHIVFGSSASDIIEGESSSNARRYLYEIDSETTGVIAQPANDISFPDATNISEDGSVIYATDSQRVYQYQLAENSWEETELDDYSGYNISAVSNSGGRLLTNGNNAVYAQNDGTDYVFDIQAHNYDERLLSADGNTIVFVEFAKRAAVKFVRQADTWVESEHDLSRLVGNNDRFGFYGNQAFLSSNGQYLGLISNSVPYINELNQHRFGNNNVLILDFVRDQFFTATPFQLEGTRVGLQALFSNDNATLYFTREGNRHFQLNKLELSSNNLSFSQNNFDVTLVSQDAVSVDVSTSQPNLFYSVERTQISTNKVEYFIASGEQFTDYRLGLSSQEYRYKVTPCSTLLVCDFDSSVSNDIDVIGFLSTPELDIEYAKILPYTTTIGVNTNLVERSNYFELKVFGRESTLVSNIDATNIKVSNQSQLDLAFAGRFCVNARIDYLENSCGAYGDVMYIDTPDLGLSRYSNANQAKPLPDLSGVEIMWPEAGDMPYQVYRRNEDTAEYALIYEGNENRYIDNDAPKGFISTYRIVACFENGNCQIANTSSSRFQRSGEPFSPRLTREGTSVNFTFSSLYSYDTYNIYASRISTVNNLADPEQKIASISGLNRSFLYTGLERGSAYAVRVEACNKEDCSQNRLFRLEDRFSFGEENLEVELENFNAVINHIGVATLTWDPIGIDFSYNVRLFDQFGNQLASKTPSSLPDGSMEVYLDDLLGDDIAIQVEASNYPAQQRAVSVLTPVFNTIDSVKSMVLASPSVTITAPNLERSATLTWSTDTNASYYKVFEKTAQTDEFTQVAIVESTRYNSPSFEITDNRKAEDLYEYAVQACDDVFEACSRKSNIVTFDNQAAPVELVTTKPSLSLSVDRYLLVEPQIPHSIFIQEVEVRVVHNDSDYSRVTSYDYLNNETYQYLRTRPSVGDTFTVNTRYCYRISRNYPRTECSQWSEDATISVDDDVIFAPSSSSVNLSQISYSTDRKTTSVSLNIYPSNQDTQPVDTMSLYKQTQQGVVELLTTYDAPFDQRLIEYVDEFDSADQLWFYYTDTCNQSACTKSRSQAARTFLTLQDPPLSTPKIKQVEQRNWNTARIDIDDALYFSDSDYRVYFATTDQDLENNGMLSSGLTLRNLTEGQTYYFIVQLCYNDRCSPFTSVNKFTMPSQQAKQASLTGKALFEASFRNGGSLHEWVVDVVSAGFDRLDITYSGVKLNSYINLEKGFDVGVDAYLVQDSTQQCKKMYTQYLSFESVYGDAVNIPWYSIVYTGLGCDELDDLEQYSVYVVSSFLEQPLKIEDREQWLEQWSSLSLTMTEGGLLTLHKNEEQVVVFDKLFDNKTISSGQFTWNYERRFSSSSVKTAMSRFAVTSFNDSPEALLFNIGSAIPTAVTVHPRVAAFRTRGDFERNIDIHMLESNQVAQSYAFDVQDNGGQNIILTIGDQRPGATIQTLSRACTDEGCSPFYGSTSIQEGFAEITRVSKPQVSVGSTSGYTLGSLQVEWQTRSPYADSYTLYGGKTGESIQEIVSIDYREFFPDGINDFFRSYVHSLTDLELGQDYQFSLEACNPINCMTSDLTQAFTVPDDMDADGVADFNDAFPNDPNETLDTDYDGIGNNADTDDDNDGLSDEIEIQLGLDPLNYRDVDEDKDNDGFSNILEYLLGFSIDNESASPKQKGVFVSYEQFENDPLRYSRPLTQISQLRSPVQGSQTLTQRMDGTDDLFVIKLRGQLDKGTIGFAYQSLYSGPMLSNILINGVSVNASSTETELSSGWVIKTVNVAAAGMAELELRFRSKEDSLQFLRLDAIYVPMSLTYVKGDFTGNGKAEMAIRNPNNAQNYGNPLPIGDGEEAVQLAFGRQKTDIPLNGDFDGDKVADFAIRRPTNNTFYAYLSSTGTTMAKPFGSVQGDLPVPADYDGDGITDIALRRPFSGQWIISKSSDGKVVVRGFGRQASDIPVAADYDGDGKDDIAIRRPNNGTWYIRESSTGKTRVVRFGLQASDIPVPADYDGDGLVDIAVRRTSNKTFYILQSSNQKVRVLRFGVQNQDIPVISDYDGDRKADIAIRRPSSYQWFILKSTTNTMQAIEYGRSPALIPYLAPLKTRMDMAASASAQATVLANTPLDIDGFEEQMWFEERFETLLEHGGSDEFGDLVEH